MAGRPWPVISAAAAAVLVLALALIPPGPGIPVFVLHIAEVLLAGGAAYALDDPAATLTDVTPRALWRRRLPRLAATAAIIAVATSGTALVLHQQRSLPNVVALFSEVLVFSLLAVAAAALVARRGEAEPGGLVAPAVALLGLAVVIAGPFVGDPLFLTDEGSTTSGSLAWLALGSAAVLVIVVASRDRGASLLWARPPRDQAG